MAGMRAYEAVSRTPSAPQASTPVTERRGSEVHQHMNEDGDPPELSEIIVNEKEQQQFTLFRHPFSVLFILSLLNLIAGFFLPFSLIHFIVIACVSSQHARQHLPSVLWPREEQAPHVLFYSLFR